MGGSSFDQFVIGKCRTMCPKEELEIRQRKRLLHILEIKPGTEKHDEPKGDLERAVKEFSRSAAGKIMTNDKYLRPPDVLLKTVHYLLHSVLRNNDVSWSVKYNFIMNRLRSVRQDMIIQNISRAYSISLLQPIVRFYAYSAYKLCDQDVRCFDPYLNKKHLQECLNRLLIIYDDVEVFLSSSGSVVDHLEFIKDSRPQFEALYIILNLGNEAALQRTLKLSKIWRTPTVETALLMSLNYLKGNLVRVCRYMKIMPPLLAALCSIHLPEIRRKSFQTMSIAYSSKNLGFPCHTLMKLLLYNTTGCVTRDCSVYGVQCDDKSIRFDKNSFNNEIGKVLCTKADFVEEKLRRTDESDLLLYNFH